MDEILPTPPPITGLNKEPKPLSFKIEKGFLVIGKESYRVTVSGQLVTSPDFLEKVRDLMEKQLGRGGIEKIQKSKEKFVITSGGIKLGETKEVISKHDKAANVSPEFTQFTEFAKSYQVHRKNLTEILRSAGYTKDDVKDAIERIIDEPVLSGEESDSWSHRTLLNVLNEVGNEGLRAAFMELKTYYKPDQDQFTLWPTERKCEAEKAIRTFLCSNITRNPRLLKTGSGTTELTFVQKFSKSTEVKNIGSIVVKEGASSRCLVTRSGQSDSQESLLEVLTHAALEQYNTCKLGFKTVNDKQEFTHHITSHLDSSDSWFARENKELQKVLDAVKQWPETGIEVAIKVPTSDTDPTLKEVKVILRRPIISSQMLSSSTPNSELSEKINFFSSLQMLPGVLGGLDKMGNRSQAALIALAKKIDTGFNGTFQDAYKLIFDAGSVHSGFFSLNEFKVFKGWIAFDLMPKCTLVYEAGTSEEHDRACSETDLIKRCALYSLLFSRSMPGQLLEEKIGIRKENTPVLSEKDIQEGKYPPAILPEEEQHALDQEVYRNILLRELGISSGKQCCRGTDRSAIGVALVIAQEGFRKRFGKDFIPENYEGVLPEDRQIKLLLFKKIYRDAINEMGLSITPELFGYSGMKLTFNASCFGKYGTNSVMLKYLFNEEDISFIKGKKEFELYPQKADVTGVTVEEYQKHGNDQYKGTLVEHEQLSHLHRRAKREEEYDHRGRVDETSRAKVESFLSSCGIPKELIRFERGLSLVTHVQFLELDQIVKGKTKTRIESIKDEIARLGTDEPGQRYLLNTIVHAYEDFSKSKNALGIPSKTHTSVQKQTIVLGDGKTVRDRVIRMNLENKISLLQVGNTGQQKKAALLKQGLKVFDDTKCTFTLSKHRLNQKQNFEMSALKSPDYFKEKFTSANELKLSATAEWYNYESSGEGSQDIWVDFANASLGGGCFGNGFIQEEIMVTEMPEMAALIAGNLDKNGKCTLSTRNGKADEREGVLKGNPNPLLLKDVHRVQKVDTNSVYGSTFNELQQATILESTKALDDVQSVNILAISAPKLTSHDPAIQHSPETIKDLFNTLMAGFTLVKEQTGEGDACVIHSGKLGCGAFNNDQKAVYLLHCLAAQHLGIEVVLHGYSNEEVQANKTFWEELEPNFKDKPIEDCLKIISEKLLPNVVQ